MRSSDVEQACLYFDHQSGVEVARIEGTVPPRYQEETRVFATADSRRGLAFEESTGEIPVGESFHPRGANSFLLDVSAPSGFLIERIRVSSGREVCRSAELYFSADSPGGDGTLEEPFPLGRCVFPGNPDVVMPRPSPGTPSPEPQTPSPDPSPEPLPTPTPPPTSLCTIQYDEGCPIRPLRHKPRIGLSPLSPNRLLKHAFRPIPM